MVQRMLLNMIRKSWADILKIEKYEAPELSDTLVKYCKN